MSRIAAAETVPTMNKAAVAPRTVPASFFGMVLGIAGLGSAWRAAHAAWGLTGVVGEILMLLAAVVWAILLVLYVRKWTVDRQAAAAELEHPVQCCFVGLIGVSTMLIAGGALPYSRVVAEILFAAGALAAVGFAVWRTGGLWHGARDAAATTPVLYLPTVAGSLVTATLAGALGRPDWGQIAFGAGLFSWLAIESVLISRLLTSPALAEALRPTLGIQLAPAAVAAVAYLTVGPGEPDIVVRALVGYGLLQALVLLRLSRWIWSGSFSPAYWAFSFGATALATAPTRLVGQSGAGTLEDLAPTLFVGANVLVLTLAMATLVAAWRDRLLPR